MNPAPTISAPPRSPSDDSPVASLTVAVIGPSASGKSSVVRELARRGVVTVHPTWTTRPPRPDERHGALEHRFVRDNTAEVALGHQLADRTFRNDSTIEALADGIAVALDTDRARNRP